MDKKEENKFIIFLRSNIDFCETISLQEDLKKKKIIVFYLTYFLNIY